MSEGSFWPKTWEVAVPLIVWCVLIFAFGFQGVEGFFPPFDIWRIVIGFGGMAGLTAMLIHWSRLKQLSDIRWLIAASMVALIVVTFSPFVEQRRWPYDIAPWIGAFLVGIILIGFAIVVAISLRRKMTSSGDTVYAKARPSMFATATVLPPAKYSKAQINKILQAIDAFYPPLIEIEQIMILGTWITGSLEAIIRDKGTTELLTQMDQLRLKLIDPSDRLDGELQKFSLYTEVCKVLNEKQSHSDAFFAAFNELAEILRQIPDQLSAPALAIFVAAKKATFIDRTASYLVWAQQKKQALSEYREWYLRHPTTD